MARLFGALQRVVFGFVLGSGLLAMSAAEAADRSVIISRDADYAGFDTQTLKDVDQKACASACVADQTCQAFTYNTKARWCFLKNDFGPLATATGAVAGRIVTTKPLATSVATKRTDELAFLGPGPFDEAKAQLGGLARAYPANGFGYAQIAKTTATAAVKNDPIVATRAYGAMLAILPEDPAVWRAFANAFLQQNSNDSGERQQAATGATSAAINAYLRSDGASDQALALGILGKALERREMWREAIKTYRLALTFREDKSIRAAYDAALRDHGFRIVSNSVDADAASPRMCVVFSDPLPVADPKLTDFIVVEGGSGLAVEPEDNQICVDGLKHGSRYTIRVRAGLPSADGETLAQTAEISSYVRDRDPWVGFAGNAYVLPAGQGASIPIDSVNASRIAATVYRIGDRSVAIAVRDGTFLRQLDTYSAEQIASQSGQEIWKGEIEVGSKLNESVTTAIPIGDALKSVEPGVYVITARAKVNDTDYYGDLATQWFIVSDLGLSALSGTDGVHAIVRSLNTAEALAGVKVKLVATNDEVLGEAKTNADGYVHFEPGLARGQGGMAPQLIVAETGAGDYAFLDLKKTAFDLTDRGVDGRPAPGKLDTFMTTERGIYRPGETVHLTALLRDAEARAVTGLPLTLVVDRPDGVEFLRRKLDDAGLGGYSADVTMPDGAQRGAWRFQLFADPDGAALADISALVDDFEPERIAFELSTSATRLTSGETFPIDLTAKYLYGAKATGLGVDGDFIATPTSSAAEFPGYSFGLSDDPVEAIRDSLGATAVTDDEGNASLEATVPELPATTKLFDAEIVVRVTDTNGRAVERRLKLPASAGGAHVGIKPGFDGGSVPEGASAKFELIAIGADGARIAAPSATWSVEKLETNYQWYRRDGAWKYEPITTSSRVVNGTADIPAEGSATVQADVKWGHYRLTVSLAGENETSSSVDFDAGWYVDAASQSETPDMLAVSMDKAHYKVGETAKLRLDPRFPGIAQIMVIDDRVIDMKTVSVPEGGTTVDLPVTANWGPGAYVTAALYRPMDIAAKRMPTRALGLAWVPVDPGDRRIAITLDTDDQIRPRGPLTIPVTLANVPAGTEAYVTVAAVDVGILNLTGFKTPAPDEWYFSQRRLGMEIRDLYGQLIDRMQGVPGKLRSGGDGGAPGLKAPPPTEKLIAYYSGIVKVGPDGKTTITFDLPDFNGTVRLMAMAWTKDGVGHAEKDVIVRDPVVVMASLPRFLTPGDQSRILVEINNVEGAAGDYRLAVDAPGVTLQPGDNDRGVRLETAAKATLALPITAEAIGDHQITVTLNGPDGASYGRTYMLGIRPAGQPISRRSLIALAPGAKLTLDEGAFGEFQQGTTSATLAVGGNARLDVPAILASLDRYPYGCTEQITSKAMPLLYLNQVAATIGIAQDSEIRKRVQASIGKVLDNQAASGSFGLWGPGYDDLWLDAFVTDFLTRAKATGYDVPEIAFNNALDNLANRIGYAQDFEKGGEAIAYSLYVLAANGKAAVGDLRYYAETKLGNFATPLAQAQIGAGLALYGDKARAEIVFKVAVANVKSGYGVQPAYRDDYGSYLRDQAAVLTLVAETDAQSADVPALVDTVASTRDQRRFISTQEQGWMLMAAASLMKDVKNASLDVDGNAAEAPLYRKLLGSDVEGRPLVVENTSTIPLEAALTLTGIPIDPEPAGGEGFTIERSYFHTDGTEADPTTVAQNDRLVVVLHVTATEARFGRLMVVDPLPAGFEIENPNISASGDTSTYEWLSVERNVAHTEARTDRFMAALNRTSQDPVEFSVAYGVRAVSPGSFVHPAATIEDMYDPDRRANTDTGRVEVVGPTVTK
ncbi:alpha-2-macroglobulin [Mesorhizobium sp. BR1-1-16]|uniref:alpha-2-macroglobulin family protein n=1 Tax=Mesorhizobium sp. BR1-1-16 TaxID=2876653 RepID=UPI001CCD007F|nr:alpha-2-macroglobulin family protein [Mesorhizobium sp. BR1-1-16]MBZ9936068.1 alpha-2-macroglobulin [Mesorhizobium sp. BR1-1-16]